MMARWHKVLGAGLGFYVGGAVGAVAGYFLGKIVSPQGGEIALDPTFKEYYKTLEVLPEAGSEDIKRSYRKLVKQYHPDLQGQVDEQTTRYYKTKMARINDAYREIRKGRNF